LLVFLTCDGQKQSNITLPSHTSLRAVTVVNLHFELFYSLVFIGSSELIPGT